MSEPVKPGYFTRVFNAAKSEAIKDFSEPLIEGAVAEFGKLSFAQKLSFAGTFTVSMFKSFVQDLYAKACEMFAHIKDAFVRAAKAVAAVFKSFGSYLTEKFSNFASFFRASSVIEPSLDLSILDEEDRLAYTELSQMAKGEKVLDTEDMRRHILNIKESRIFIADQMKNLEKLLSSELTPLARYETKKVYEALKNKYDILTGALELQILHGENDSDDESPKPWYTRYWKNICDLFDLFSKTLDDVLMSKDGLFSALTGLCGKISAVLRLRFEISRTPFWEDFKTFSNWVYRLFTGTDYYEDIRLRNSADHLMQELERLSLVASSHTTAPLSTIQEIKSRYETLKQIIPQLMRICPRESAHYHRLFTTLEKQIAGFVAGASATKRVKPVSIFLYGDAAGKKGYTITSLSEDLPRLLLRYLDSGKLKNLSEDMREYIRALCKSPKIYALNGMTEKIEFEDGYNDPFMFGIQENQSSEIKEVNQAWMHFWFKMIDEDPLLLNMAYEKGIHYMNAPVVFSTSNAKSLSTEMKDPNALYRRMDFHLHVTTKSGDQPETHPAHSCIYTLSRESAAVMNNPRLRPHSLYSDFFVGPDGQHLPEITERTTITYNDLLYGIAKLFLDRLVKGKVPRMDRNIDDGVPEHYKDLACPNEEQLDRLRSFQKYEIPLKPTVQDRVEDFYEQKIKPVINDTKQTFIDVTDGFRDFFEKVKDKSDEDLKKLKNHYKKLNKQFGKFKAYGYLYILIKFFKLFGKSDVLESLEDNLAIESYNYAQMVALKNPAKYDKVFQEIFVEKEGKPDNGKGKEKEGYSPQPYAPNEFFGPNYEDVFDILCERPTITFHDLLPSLITKRQTLEDMLGYRENDLGQWAAFDYFTTVYGFDPVDISSGAYFDWFVMKAEDRARNFKKSFAIISSLWSSASSHTLPTLNHEVGSFIACMDEVYPDLMPKILHGRHRKSNDEIVVDLAAGFMNKMLGDHDWIMPVTDDPSQAMSEAFRVLNFIKATWPKISVRVTPVPYRDWASSYVRLYRNCFSLAKFYCEQRIKPNLSLRRFATHLRGFVVSIANRAIGTIKTIKAVSLEDRNITVRPNPIVVRSYSAMNRYQMNALAILSRITKRGPYGRTDSEMAMIITKWKQIDEAYNTRIKKNASRIVKQNARRRRAWLAQKIAESGSMSYAPGPKGRHAYDAIMHKHVFEDDDYDDYNGQDVDEFYEERRNLREEERRYDYDYEEREERFRRERQLEDEEIYETSDEPDQLQVALNLHYIGLSYIVKEDVPKPHKASNLEIEEMDKLAAEYFPQYTFAENFINKMHQVLTWPFRKNRDGELESMHATKWYHWARIGYYQTNSFNHARYFDDDTKFMKKMFDVKIPVEWMNNLVRKQASRGIYEAIIGGIRHFHFVMHKRYNEEKVFTLNADQIQEACMAFILLHAQYHEFSCGTESNLLIDDEDYKVAPKVAVDTITYLIFNDLKKPVELEKIDFVEVAQVLTEKLTPKPVDTSGVFIEDVIISIGVVTTVVIAVAALISSITLIVQRFTPVPKFAAQLREDIMCMPRPNLDEKEYAVYEVMKERICKGLKDDHAFLSEHYKEVLAFLRHYAPEKELESMTPKHAEKLRQAGKKPVNVVQKARTTHNLHAADDSQEPQEEMVLHTAQDDKIIKIIMANMYAICSPTSGQHYGNLIFIGGRIANLNNHVWQSIPKQFCLVPFSPKRYADTKIHTFSKSMVKELYIDESTESIDISFGTYLYSHKNIQKFIQQRPDEERVSTRVVSEAFILTFDQQAAHGVREPLSNVTFVMGKKPAVYTMPDFSYSLLLKQRGHYNWSGAKPSTCGSIILLKQAGTIQIGLRHTAGSSSGLPSSAGAFLWRDQFDKYFKLDDPTNLHPGMLVGDNVSLNTEDMILHTFHVCDETDRFVTPIKTTATNQSNYYPTQFHTGKFRGGADLQRSKMGIDALKYAYEREAKTEIFKQYSHEIVEAYEADPDFDPIGDFFFEAPPEDIGLNNVQEVTAYEAIYGHNGLDHADFKTADGPRFKTLGFPKDVMSNPKDPRSKLVVETVEQYHSLIETHDAPLQYNSDCLKDELTTEERAILNHTRLFCVTDPIDNWVILMTIMQLVLVLKRTLLFSASCCGINPLTSQWDSIYNLFKNCPSLVFTDVKSFDHCATSWLYIPIGRFFARICGGRTTKTYHRFMFAFISCVEALRFNNGVGRRNNRGNSSGNVATTVFNTFVNFCFFATVIFIQCRKKGIEVRDVLHHLRIRLYSDDNISALPFDWWTTKFVGLEFKRLYGIILTDVRKVPINQDTQDIVYTISDCEFLSRTFRHVNGITYAPLSLSSILSQLYYVRLPKNRRTMEELYKQLQVNLDNVAAELVELDYDLARKIALEIVTFISKNRLPVTFKLTKIFPQEERKLCYY